MNETPASNEARDEPGLYEIRIRGHLGSRWAYRLEGFTISLEDSGNTILTGRVVDQAALHGLLKKVRDFGMPLLSVNRVQSGQRGASDVQ